MTVDVATDLRSGSLAVPVEERAEYFLREVDFEERLAGIIMKPQGTMAVTMYSLEQVVDFFARDNTDHSVEPGSRFTENRRIDVAYIDPVRLESWIREVIGDSELADGIAAATSGIPEGQGYPPVMRAMRDLVGLRHSQCREVLGLSTGPEEGPDVEQDPAGR